MDMESVLLEIKDLSIETNTSAARTLCSKINLKVRKQSILGIVGESGSGKTLTSLAIMGLLPPGLKTTHGEVILNLPEGVQILNRLSEEGIRQIRGNRIGMIFQEPMTSLNPSMTCGHQVMEAIRVHQDIPEAEAKRKVIQLFEKVKLPQPESVFKSFPHQLSGGQRQRVMIAIALSCNPLLLIADEPTTALDVTVQKSIFALLKELQQEFNMSVIFITHDLGIIAELASDVVVMYKGEIVEQGETSSILENPQHPYTKALLACRTSHYQKGHRLMTIRDHLSDKANSQIWENQKKPDVLLDVKNLSVFFADRGKSNFFSKFRKQTLFDLSFQVYQGETLGLVGESGSGKTTLSRALLKLIDSVSSSVQYRNIELSRLKGEQLRLFRKNIQIIFQDPNSSLNPKQTIGQIILEPMVVHGLHQTNKQRWMKVKELLGKVELSEDMLSRYPHQLSGGQRQRVGIARALAVQPELIICDESVSALDVSVQAQVLNLLNDLKSEFGLTYIFISHDLNVVRYMSDRMIVLRSGNMVEYGNAEEIFNQPASGYTRELIAAIPGKNRLS